MASPSKKAKYSVSTGQKPAAPPVSAPPPIYKFGGKRFRPLSSDSSAAASQRPPTGFAAAAAATAPAARPPTTNGMGGMGRPFRVFGGGASAVSSGGTNRAPFSTLRDKKPTFASPQVQPSGQRLSSGFAAFSSSSSVSLRPPLQNFFAAPAVLQGTLFQRVDRTPIPPPGVPSILPRFDHARIERRPRSSLPMLYRFDERAHAPQRYIIREPPVEERRATEDGESAAVPEAARIEIPEDAERSHTNTPHSEDELIDVVN